MFTRADYEQYLKYRWGDDRDLASKLRPVPASTAWCWLKSNLARRARDRLDPLDEIEHEVFTMRGVTFKLNRYYDSDHNPYEGMCKFSSKNVRGDVGPQGNSGVYHVEGREVTLEYGEDEMYQDARKHASKGIARYIAQLDRRASLKWIRDVMRGNITFTSYHLTCEQLPKFNHWGGPWTDDEEDEMRAEIEDALRSAFSEISVLKDRP